MRPRTALTLLALLLALGAATGLAAGSGDDFTLGGDAEAAAADYEKYCVTCHGPEGKGDGVMAKFLDPKPKDLTDAEYMTTRTDRQIYTAIMEGGAAVGLSEKMAPWKHLLSDEQIRDLAAYVRTLAASSSPEGD